MLQGLTVCRVYMKKRRCSRERVRARVLRGGISRFFYVSPPRDEAEE
ncbi:MAG: hypothetical protein RJB39_246 [Candidatus Parcubacteria bacterium]|jgi:hypothetical protein